MAVTLYVVRNLCLIVSYHRYFAHRSFKTSRVVQFLLAIAGSTAAERGVLWWAQKHRLHHRHADTPDDVHSPHHQGTLYSHAGWFLDPAHQTTDLAQVSDFAKYPELRLLDTWNFTVQLALAAALYAWGGWHAVLWGYCGSTVLVWHSTHVIQSVAHLWGRRDYATSDESRNSWLLGVLVLGDGWHNNHHYYPASARHGFVWWQVDPAYWVIRVMAWVGLVWDVRTPPPRVLRARGRAETRYLGQLAMAVLAARCRLERRCQVVAEAVRGGARAAIIGYAGWAVAEVDQFAEALGDHLLGGPACLREASQRLVDRLADRARADVYSHLSEDAVREWEQEFAAPTALFTPGGRLGDPTRVSGSSP